MDMVFVVSEFWRRIWTWGTRDEKKWVVDIRDQCRKENVLFFFKQWGGTRKSKTGRELDGRTYDEMPGI